MESKVEIRIRLRIKFKIASELCAVMNSLMPDNIDCPDGLSVEMYGESNCLVFDISCKREICVIINTVDEILSHITMARHVISNA